MLLLKKECFIHMVKIYAFELINGKAIKLMSKNFNKDEIKFVTYSNKIKPEIEDS